MGKILFNSLQLYGNYVKGISRIASLLTLAIWGFFGKNNPMSIEDPEIPPDQNSEHAKLTRAINHDLDIMNTRMQPQLGEYNHEAEAEAEQLIHGIDEYIRASKDGLSIKEVRDFIQKLDTAIAISNEPEAREIRRNLIERYGDPENPESPEQG